MEKIDRSQWKRSVHCDFFGRIDVPFYSITFRLDVTALHAYCKARGISFYSGMIWITMRAVNGLPPFLCEIHGEDVYRLDRRDPSYTYPFDGDLFGICTLPWQPGESMASFDARRKAAEAQNAAPLPSVEADADGHCVYISCLPWIDYEHVAQEFPLDRDDSTPRILWGKYRKETDGRLTLAYTAQVNHRLLDGVHIAKLQDALKAELFALETEN